MIWVLTQALARLDPIDKELTVRSAEDQLRSAQMDAEQAAPDEICLRCLLADHSVSEADHEHQKARSDAATARLVRALCQRDLPQPDEIQAFVNHKLIDMVDIDIHF